MIITDFLLTHLIDKYICLLIIFVWVSMKSECPSWYCLISWANKILSPDQKYLMQILWDINPQEGQNKWSIIESVTVTEPTKAFFVTASSSKKISVIKLDMRQAKIPKLRSYYVFICCEALMKFTKWLGSGIFTSWGW